MRRSVYVHEVEVPGPGSAHRAAERLARLVEGAIVVPRRPYWDRPWSKARLGEWVATVYGVEAAECGDDIECVATALGAKCAVLYTEAGDEDWDYIVFADDCYEYMTVLVKWVDDKIVVSLKERHEIVEDAVYACDGDIVFGVGCDMMTGAAVGRERIVIGAPAYKAVAAYEYIVSELDDKDYCRRI